MLISAMTVTVALPLAHSLKDKRMTAKSLIARVQNRFKVSAAEVEAQDEWCTLVLGLAVVANERRHGEQVLEEALQFIEAELAGTGEVTGVVDFEGLQEPSDRTPETDVFNGIAYDAASGDIYVTGKNWNKLYKVEIFEKEKGEE